MEKRAKVIADNQRSKSREGKQTGWKIESNKRRRGGFGWKGGLCEWHVEQRIDS